ncbi:unnamed protein product [Linum tenue]|uniref:Uncharacterized protein n=1 Tax=Linum tenue TaxID=586396 RepID=A0AAV0RBA6_9ROSI|nr:unnamed protein product [Linum tenue]
MVIKPQQPAYSTCLLLLSIIILSHHIHSIEAARGFKIDQSTLDDSSTASTKGSATVEVEDAAVTGPPPPVVATGEPQQPPWSAAAPGRGTDDFRPTTPGHSPGVGHSTHN